MDCDSVIGISLYSGAGGLEIGLQLALGRRYRCIAYAEREAYAAAVIAARMADGSLDEALVWDDVSTFPGDLFCGKVDIVSAGFPCQPHSLAGKRLGIEDERWGWPNLIRAVRAIRPRYLFVENVPGIITSGGFGTILGDLAESGFSVEWDLFSAAEVGAPHIRRRFFLLAHAERDGGVQRSDPDMLGGWTGPAQLVGLGRVDVADACGARRQQVSGSPHGDEAADEGRAAINGHQPQCGDEALGHSDRGTVPRSEWGSQAGDGSRSPSEAVAHTQRSGRGTGQRDHDAGQPNAPGGGAGPWRFDGYKTILGYDEFGEPLYATQSGKQILPHPSRRGIARWDSVVGTIAVGVAHRDGLGELRREAGQRESDADRHGGAVGVGLADPDRTQRPRHGSSLGSEAAQPAAQRDRGGFLFPPARDDDAGWRDLLACDPSLEPAVRRDAPWLAYRLDRVRTIGNGVVPVVAAVAFLRLRDRLRDVT